METLAQGLFTGERALYNSKDLRIIDSVFADGESPLKESSDIELSGCIFKWKYPIWYSKNVTVEDSTLLVTARSGIWYTDNIRIKNTTIDAPKTFRRCKGVRLEGCTMPEAAETLWSCSDVDIIATSASGDYFGMNSDSVRAKNFSLSGNYAFDGGKNIEISSSRLISKDAFWNCENVTVRDSVIIGEYLGWNSKNVTFINCTIESNQGLCYMENVKLVNCKLLLTDLAFEYSTVDAEVTTEIDSIKNPMSGRIRARSIKDIIVDGTLVDPSATEIIVEDNG